MLDKADMMNIVLWLTALAEVAVAVMLAVLFRRRVTAKSAAEARAKAVYSWLCATAGVLSGVLFLGATALLEIPTGHGEILIAAPLFYLAMAGLLIVLERIVIGWVPMRW